VSERSERSESADLDELVREVDRRCDADDWDGLLALRDKAKRAYEDTGRQLWPAASLAEYRLALLAPAEIAALVVVEGAGHLALGPIPEVAASTHEWRDLAPHVPAGPAAWQCAAERVVRGETVHDVVLDVPTARAPWEPEYLVPTYRRDEVETCDPEPVRSSSVPLPAAVESIEDEGSDALRALVERWAIESNGTIRAVAVKGTAEDAVAAVHPAPSVEWSDVDAPVALQHMAWAAASGGAHGRRHGAAIGRFGALWALAALGGCTEDWPLPSEDLGDVAADLRWCLWHPAGPREGWYLHLAVEDPEAGLAWAVAATDSRSGR
jgi:hypothetical protein